MAAGLVAAGDAGRLADFALILETDGEVGDLTVLHLVTGGRTVVGQNLQ